MMPTTSYATVERDRASDEIRVGAKPARQSASEHGDAVPAVDFVFRGAPDRRPHADVEERRHAPRSSGSAPGSAASRRRPRWRPCSRRPAAARPSQVVLRRARDASGSAAFAANGPGRGARRRLASRARRTAARAGPPRRRPRDRRAGPDAERQRQRHGGERLEETSEQAAFRSSRIRLLTPEIRTLERRPKPGFRWNVILSRPCGGTASLTHQWLADA